MAAASPVLCWLSVEQVRKLLATGYEKVIINTGLIRSPEMVREAASLFGSQSIV